jgi:hypothetical protein
MVLEIRISFNGIYYVEHDFEFTFQLKPNVLYILFCESIDFFMKLISVYKEHCCYYHKNFARKYNLLNLKYYVGH